MCALRLTAKKIAEYRDGGEGFVKWCNENVRIAIYPEGSDMAQWCLLGELPETPNPHTGRSYAGMWRSQQKILKKALEMKTEPNGTKRFKHRLIVLCWMRGEGKSAVVCLIQMWKFFCWPKQQIVLGANSKDQTKFVHYDIIKEMILNSPNLLEWVGGRENVQEKMICMRDSKGAVMSAIRSISSFSGIVSNITGYTFSEMFDMNNPKFFTQLDGSTRNVPNALGTIDSTVSTKDHVLYKMYEAYIQNKIPDLFFSYRCSPAGDHNDFYHPQNTQAQLDSYKEKFPAAEFDRYFKNLWDAGAVRFFTDTDVAMTHYWGVYQHANVPEKLRERMNDIMVQKGIAAGHLKEMEEQESTIALSEQYKYDIARIQDMEKDLYPVEDTFRLMDNFGEWSCATSRELALMSQMFKTDWSIHVGLDRADPMSTETMTRTILTMTAKGLPGSHSGFHAIMAGKEPPYIYITIGFEAFKAHNLDDIKETIQKWAIAVDGIDTFCSERWGAWDLEKWCQDEGISCELISPTYEKQRASFNEFYNLVKQGRWKIPPTHFIGSRGEDDVIDEELKIFLHDPDKKWFGSPEKKAKGGVQDDCIYSVGWSIYGGRNHTFEMFRPRGRSMTGIGYIPATGLLGAY